MASAPLSSDELSAPWAAPWHVVLNESEKLVQEFKRECPFGHCLKNVDVSVLAMRQDCDDVLFRLDDSSGRYAVVHLTGQLESDPKWPWTVLFKDFSDFVANCLIPDIADFNS